MNILMMYIIYKNGCMSRPRLLDICTGWAPNVQKLSHDGRPHNVAIGHLQRYEDDRHGTTFEHWQC